MTPAQLLIIDDNLGICKTLSDIFKGKGYGVSTANTGHEAIENLQKKAFDIALIDIKLPDTDGTALLKEIKKAYPEMVCIIITGHASLQSTINALKEGANGYFIKPLMIDEVIHKVEDALDKQRLQREIRESEERYRGLVETSTDAIISINEKMEIICWNKAASKIFGYPEEEVMGKPVDILVPEKYKQGHIEGFKRYLETGESVLIGKTAELEGVRKDGAIIPVGVSLSALKRSGSYIFTGIIRDITERKKLENELRRNLDEVERINKLMVGRELKMGEMKKRIKELEMLVAKK